MYSFVVGETYVSILVASFLEPTILFGNQRMQAGKSIVGIPPNGWFIVEHAIHMDDSGVPSFMETTILFGIQRMKAGKSLLGIPPNGWFIVEHPIHMVDSGLPPVMETKGSSLLAQKTLIYIYIYNVLWFRLKSNVEPSRLKA